MDNPGSPEAVKQGCKCPVDDNHQGAGVPYSDGNCWWTVRDCPLHGSADDGK